MPKIKLTKNELKKQRDSLDQFSHYLPILQLKKQQLQMRIGQVKALLQQKQSEADQLQKNIFVWAGVLADVGVDISRWIVPKEILWDIQNIAGIDIPIFREVVFAPLDYDLYVMPLWVDEAIEKLRQLCSLLAQGHILQEQIKVLHKELMVTTQRVNLFEKVKIPECFENIRMIRIYLGDQQASAVGVSKFAKKKIEQAAYEEALA